MRCERAVGLVVAVLTVAAGGRPGPAAAQSPGDGAAPAEAREAARRDSVLSDAAGWLAGCWRTSAPDGRSAVEEQWMPPRGGLMVGMSRSVRDGEARGYELLTIRVEDDRLVYHAAPSGQASTDFPARSIEDGRVEFVNAEHDFPQKIVYALLREDRLQASVFAEAGGEEPAFVLPYRRAVCPGA